LAWPSSLPIIGSVSERAAAWLAMLYRRSCNRTSGRLASTLPSRQQQQLDDGAMERLGSGSASKHFTKAGNLLIG